MPPNAFNPRHTTPFKSSISSSQAPRAALRENHHGGSAAQWPPNPPVTERELDPRDWEYVSEGAKNMVVRYIGNGDQTRPSWGTVALRIPKVPRGSTAPEPSSGHDQIDADAFAERVIGPLLPSPSLLTGSVPIALTPAPGAGGEVPFLDKLAACIEAARPLARRKADGIDVRAREVRLVEDVTGSSFAADGRQEDVLAIEIKPKWGFLPSGAHLSEATRGFKTRHSRFRMHQVLKSEHSQPDSDETADKTSSSAEQALVAMGGSAFDPLDLYSGDLDRAARAVRALYASWRLNNGANNLRLFLSGRLIDPSKSDDRDVLLSFFSSPPIEHTSRAGSSFDDADAVLANLLSALVPALIEAPVLSRLSSLQRALDPLDVEGLSNWWRAQTRCEFGSAPSTAPELLAPPTIDEWAEIAQGLVDREQRAAKGEEDESALTLRQATLAFLLSATFKDCSLFVRLSASSAPASTSGPSSEASRAPGPSESAIASHSLTATLSPSERPDAPFADTASAPATVMGRTSRQRFGYTMKLIDLDPKPLEKLAHYERLDKEIVQAFARFVEKFGEPGAATE